MGYRSEVALTLKKEDGLELIRQAKENEPVRNLMSCANIIDQNEFITFHWISVKWYGSFEGVRFIKGQKKWLSVRLSCSPQNR